jgi:putative transposase
MKRKRFSEERIIKILRQHRAGARPGDLCRQHGISEATLYNWRIRYGGMQVSEAKRLRSLEDENRRLKKLLAEAMLDNAALKDIASGKCQYLLHVLGGKHILADLGRWPPASPLAW